MSNTLNVHLQRKGGGGWRVERLRRGVEAAGEFSCCDLVGNEPQRDTPADRESGETEGLLLYTGRGLGLREGRSGRVSGTRH